MFQLEPCEDSHNCHVWKEVEIFGDEEEAEVEKIPLSVLVLLDKVMMIMSVTYKRMVITLARMKSWARTKIQILDDILEDFFKENKDTQVQHI